MTEKAIVVLPPEEPKNVGEKVTGVLGSLRFWVVTAATAVATLAEYGAIPGAIAAILVKYLAVVVGIGTADSIAKKVGAYRVMR